MSIKRQQILVNLVNFHKRLFEISGKPVMSNCGTASEQWSVLLDYHLKKIMQKGWSYIKDSEYFI